MLTTDRLDLVPLDLERDLSDLHVMFSDPAWAEASFSDPAGDADESRARLDSEFGGNVGLTWVLRLRPSAPVIGVIGVFSDQGTPVRGIGWYLHREHWGQGLMSEAALVVVDHLLGLPGIDGVEAWVDSRNTRSIGVARRARLEVVGRLPRVYAGETAQSVVMARAAVPADPVVIGIRPVLPVREVPPVVDLLVGVLGMHLLFQYGDPEPEFARLGSTQWSGTSHLDLLRSAEEIQPTTLALDVGMPVDPLHQAAVDTGFAIATPPADTPWYRREFSLRLAEGHLLTISGPTPPPGRP
jgi:RimJ/RimL family protein N-acetyltransferase